MQFNCRKDNQRLKYDENQEMLIWLTVTKIYFSLSTRYLDVSWRAWNYNTNRNNMPVNSFIKVYCIWHGFEVERDLL